MATPPRWYMGNLRYTHWDTGMALCILTNTNCHLTCRWTENAPLRHRTSRLLRGENLPWSAYWCFNAYTDVEQEEAGDTAFHTFIFNDWLPGITRWWSCFGTIGGIDSPSATAIFEHTHPGGLPLILTIRPDAPGDFCSRYLDGTGAPCPNHYWTIREPPPHNDDLWLTGQTINHWWGYDSYNIPDLQVGKIEKITHVMRIRRLGTRPSPFVHRHLLRINAINYVFSRNYTPTVFTDYSHDYPTNPATGFSWTQADLASLQPGIGLRHTWGIGWTSTGECSEVYITVTRGIECPPLPPTSWP